MFDLIDLADTGVDILPYKPTGKAQGPERTEPYASYPVQDPNEQAWMGDSNIAGMQGVDDPDDEYNAQGGPAVRNAFGQKEFLHHLVEEVADFLGVDTPFPDKAPQIKPIRTREQATSRFRPTRHFVTDRAAQASVVRSDYRRRITLVNVGANPIYVSNIAPSLPGSGNFPNSNQFTLFPASATLDPTRVLATKDDFWFVCGNGLTSTVEVIEEFDDEIC
jgi:hypothetical protein